MSDAAATNEAPAVQRMPMMVRYCAHPPYCALMTAAGLSWSNVNHELVMIAPRPTWKTNWPKRGVGSGGGRDEGTGGYFVCIEGTMAVVGLVWSLEAVRGQSDKLRYRLCKLKERDTVNE